MTAAQFVDWLRLLAIIAIGLGGVTFVCWAIGLTKEQLQTLALPALGVAIGAMASGIRREAAETDESRDQLKPPDGSQ